MEIEEHHYCHFSLHKFFLFFFTLYIQMNHHSEQATASQQAKKGKKMCTQEHITMQVSRKPPVDQSSYTLSTY